MGKYPWFKILNTYGMKVSPRKNFTITSVTISKKYKLNQLMRYIYNLTLLINVMTVYIKITIQFKQNTAAV